MDNWPQNYVDLFWREYPRRIAKKSALRALDKVRKSGEVSFEVLINAVRQFAISVSRTEMQFIPHPATWLNQGRWDDDISAITGGSSTADVGRSLLAKLHDADFAANDARRGGEGCDAHDDGLYDVSRH